jgi:hydrogenase nickel incorporation protein HypA/HybF
MAGFSPSVTVDAKRTRKGPFFLEKRNGMHELSLADAIVSALLKMCEDEAWGRVKKVRLRVGALRQVFPEMLEFAFSTVVKDTALSGALLEIEEIPLEWRCLECGNRWREDSGVCPLCGSFNRETLAGMELEIHSVEVEET